MKKFVVAAGALLVIGVLTWSGTSASAATAPAAPGDCFGNWLSCLSNATQDLACCIDPNAQGCGGIIYAPPEVPDLQQKLSCRSEFQQDFAACDESLISCLTGPQPPAKRRS
jgi:hypothetical protein